jgi:murein DD-endopeptidase MepM/ murein hydrolase activator NlpD
MLLPSPPAVVVPSAMPPAGVTPEPSEPEPPARTVGPRSNELLPGLWNPMPGGVVAGYRADTGLDIMGIKMPVYAIASGWLDYAEAGHTLWTGPRDTPLCARIELDKPIPYKGRSITHLYYAHLSELSFTQAEGARPRIHVEAGERLGTSGVANGSWHLHVGLLLDGKVEQYAGTYLFEDEIREVLGGLRKGARLSSVSPAPTR